MIITIVSAVASFGVGVFVGHKVSLAVVEAKLKAIETAIVEDGKVVTEDLKTAIAAVIAKIRSAI